MPEGTPGNGQSAVSNRLTMLPLFAGLRPEDAEALVRSCRALQLGPGAPLFRQGEPAVDLYIVLDGVLDIAVAAPGQDVVVVGHVGPGDLVGEMGVVESVPRSATVCAQTHAQLLCLDGASFRELIDAAHPAAWSLLRAIRRTIVRRLLQQRASQAGEAFGALPVDSPGGEPGATPEASLVHRLRGFLDALVGGAP